MHFSTITTAEPLAYFPSLLSSHAVHLQLVCASEQLVTSYCKRVVPRNCGAVYLFLFFFQRHWEGNYFSVGRRTIGPYFWRTGSARNTQSEARLLRRPAFKHSMLAFSVNRLKQREAGKRLFTCVCDTVEEVENKRPFFLFILHKNLEVTKNFTGQTAESTLWVFFFSLFISSLSIICTKFSENIQSRGRWVGFL